MSDQTAQTGSTPSRGVPGGRPPGLTESDGGLSRRGLLRAAGAGAAVVGGGGLLEACSSSIKGATTSSSSSSSASSSAGASTQPIVIGFIHPLTGALGDFGTSDDWIVSTIQATPQYKNGFKVGGKTYPVTIKSYDTQSDPTRAGQLANQAILTDKVDLIVTSSTPETVNPVATVAEKLGCPTLGGNVPWQAWYANLGGNPTPGKSTFKPTWTTMYFLGVNDLCNSFIPMWNKIHAQLSTDKVVGCMFPNDDDGNAFRAAWPLFACPAGYTLVDPPAYTDGQTELLLVHQPVQVEELRVLHQRAAAARLQRVLEAGRAAGLQAEAGHRGQGAAVPVRRGRARLAGQQRRHRRLVDAEHAVEVLAHRADLRPRSPPRTPRPPDRSGCSRCPTTACSRSPTRP